MKSILYLLLFCAVSSLVAQESFIIENVTVFDGEKVMPATSVTIQNGRIEALGMAPTEGELRIDGTGKFLIPALTNSHVNAFSPLALQEAANARVLNLFDMHGMEPILELMKPQRNTPGVARLYVSGYAATGTGGHETQYGFV